jgi:hypothetical protein
MARKHGWQLPAHTLQVLLRLRPAPYLLASWFWIGATEITNPLCDLRECSLESAVRFRPSEVSLRWIRRVFMFIVEICRGNHSGSDFRRCCLI